ncbi:MAG: serine hydrolase domain-containing protein [Actinomycetota bacterium]
MPGRARPALTVIAVAIAAAGCGEGGDDSPEADRRKPDVDVVFAEFDRPGSPGCAVGIADEGEVVVEEQYGEADLEAGTPITEETVFDVGSVSKQFTAASILLLEQDGALSLDDEVHMHLPELPEYGEEVLLDDLVHHTSGIPDYIGLLFDAGFDERGVSTTADAVAALVAEAELDFVPGTRFAYSNSNYFLLSLVVERVSGLSLRQFADEQIFEPLGMDRSFFRDDFAEAVEHRALGYEDGTLALYTSAWEQTGDGAFHTTVADLLAWADNFTTGEVGGDALVDAMLEPGQLDDGSVVDYSAGVVVTGAGRDRTISHSGAWVGYTADLEILPERDLAVAVTCNVTVDPEALAADAVDAYQ